MATSYVLREGARELQVEVLADDGGRARVRVDGELLEISTRTLPSGALAVRAGRRRLRLWAWRDRGGQHLSGDGLERCYDVRDERALWLAGPGGPRSHQGGQVVASMPGRVVGVPVTEGDAVEEGAVVAVLEAMKMENDVRAPISGEVAQIAVRAGDAVEAGQLLLVLRES